VNILNQIEKDGLTYVIHQMKKIKLKKKLNQKEKDGLTYLIHQMKKIKLKMMMIIIIRGIFLTFTK
jgi:hypothetical protein